MHTYTQNKDSLPPLEANRLIALTNLGGAISSVMDKSVLSHFRIAYTGDTTPFHGGDNCQARTLTRAFTRFLAHHMSLSR